MKRTAIISAAVIVCGILIAAGPQFLFPACAHGESVPRCHWSVQAETGVGSLIAALGVCLLLFSDSRTRQGMYVGVFLAGIVALLIPHALIGGCGSMTMTCQRITFPIISVICIIVILVSVINVVLLESSGGQKPLAAAN